MNNFDALLRGYAALFEGDTTSRDYYHGTYIASAANVMKDHFIHCTNQFTARSDTLGGKNFWFLSMSHQPFSGYMVNMTNFTDESKYHRSGAIFVLDGNKVRSNYKVMPVDYWGDLKPKTVKEAGSYVDFMRNREQEERLMTSKSKIPDSVIKELHVYVSPNDSSNDADYVKRMESNVDYPVFFYDDLLAFSTLNKQKAITYTDMGKEGEPTKQFKPHNSDIKYLKHIRDSLENNFLDDDYQFQTRVLYSMFDRGIENTLAYAIKSTTTDGNEDLNYIIRYMKRHGIHSLKDLFTHLRDLPNQTKVDNLERKEREEREEREREHQRAEIAKNKQFVETEYMRLFGVRKYPRTVIAHLGDVNYMDHGGGLVYDDGLMFYVEPDRSNGNELPVYRMHVDNFNASDLDWAEDIDITGFDEMSLGEKANKLMDVADHYGWENFDPYPHYYTKSELYLYMPDTNDIDKIIANYMEYKKEE